MKFGQKCAIGFVVAFAAALLFLRLTGPDQFRFLVPEGYLGAVVVYFNHPAGSPLIKEDGVHVFRIPPSGALLIRDPMPDNSAIEEWLWVGKDGNMRAIPLATEHGKEPGMVGSGTHSGTAGTYVQNAIGIPDEPESFGRSHMVVNQIQLDLQRLRR